MYDEQDNDDAGGSITTGADMKSASQYSSHSGDDIRAGHKVLEQAVGMSHTPNMMSSGGDAMSGAEAARYQSRRSAKNTPDYRNAEQEQIRESASGAGGSTSDEATMARMKARSADNRLLDINRKSRGGPLGAGGQ